MRVLVVGDIHFVDEKGLEIDVPEIETPYLVIPLEKGEDADEVGEQWLAKGYNSYTTLYGKKGQEAFDKVCPYVIVGVNQNNELTR